MLSPTQKARKGLDYLEEAILDILQAESSAVTPTYITERLRVSPMVIEATGAKYSSIVITVLEMLEEKGKVESVRAGKYKSHRRWINI